MCLLSSGFVCTVDLIPNHNIWRKMPVILFKWTSGDFKTLNSLSKGAVGVSGDC